jgi:tetratricopeptide (TPR) repeat protein
MALGLDPRLAYGHYAYAVCLAALGWFDDALEHAREACQLDPLNGHVASVLGRIHYLARNFDAAVDAMRLTLVGAPQTTGARIWLALSLLELGSAEAAWTEVLALRDAEPGSALILGLVGYVAARAGLQVAAQEILAELERRPASTAYHMGLLHIGLGRPAEALDWFEQAARDHSAGLITFGIGALFDPVRTDPRFRALLSEVGVPT